MPGKREDGLRDKTSNETVTQVFVPRRQGCERLSSLSINNFHGALRKNEEISLVSRAETGPMINEMIARKRRAATVTDCIREENGAKAKAAGDERRRNPTTTSSSILSSSTAAILLRHLIGSVPLLGIRFEGRLLKLEAPVIEKHKKRLGKTFCCKHFVISYGLER